MAYTPFDLTGKVALVTGGNSGIGLGMAVAMAQAGADIAIWGTNAAKNAAAAETLAPTGRKVLTIRCDVGDEADVQAAFATHLRNVWPGRWLLRQCRRIRARRAQLSGDDQSRVAPRDPRQFGRRVLHVPHALRSIWSNAATAAFWSVPRPWRRSRERPAASITPRQRAA